MKLEGEMTQLGQPRKGREEDHSGCLEQLAANEVEIKESSEENFRENISACSQGDLLRTQSCREHNACFYPLDVIILLYV